MKTPTQLAAEAAEDLRRLANDDFDMHEIRNVIKSAIEKAREPLLVFLSRCADHMICGSNIADTPIPTEQEWRDILGETRAAQASEPIDEDFLDGLVPPDLGAAQASERKEAGYPRCEGCGDPIVGILTTPTGLCHELCAKDVPIGDASEPYDDMLPVSLHKSKNGIYHLLDRHNDEIATFGRAMEIKDMERIIKGINGAAQASEIDWEKMYRETQEQFNKMEVRAQKAENALAAQASEPIDEDISRQANERRSDEQVSLR